MESITLKVIQGERLEDADRWSDSDPYVLVEVLDDNKAVRGGECGCGGVWQKWW